jgi:deoxyribose-phosphate aldolase
VTDLRRAAARALACLDLTNLDDGCTSTDIRALCDRARTPHGPVAAVCLYPRFVAEAKERLEGSGIRVATVVNFPRGDSPLAFVLDQTADALAEGADEIDLVIPWRPFLAGEEHPVREMVGAVRAATQGRVLKTILETGELGDPARITRAAEIAVEEGTDFLKTSTGKVAVNATPEAAQLLLDVIRGAPRRVGLKPAGGVRTTEDAATYLALCDRVMGPDWAGPATFRIGASGVLAALLATLDGGAGPAPAGGY